MKVKYGGTMQPADNGTPSAIVRDDGQLFFGGYPGLSDHMYGRLANVRFYKKVLSSEEIAQDIAYTPQFA